MSKKAVDKLKVAGVVVDHLLYRVHLLKGHWTAPLCCAPQGACATKSWNIKKEGNNC